MAIPSSIQARLYHRCAFGRYEDAQILLKADRTTGAVYLAGYGIECILKALILSAISPKAEATVIGAFRGVRAHDYRWLQERYYENGRPRFPKEVVRTFAIVDEWSTDLRYLPRSWKRGDAREFLAASKTIIEWVNERI